VTIVIKIEITIPINGAKNMNNTVFKMVWLSTTLLQDRPGPSVNIACVIAAPANPPIRVWDEEEGMPYHQVRRFQEMAAIKPARITCRVIYSLNTVLLMVFATAWSLKIQ
jgi:hypothetical protein